MGKTGNAAQVDCNSIWDSPLATGILRAFAQWGPLVLHQQVSGNVEVEARLGKIVREDGVPVRFEPGVDDATYTAIQQYLFSKIPKPHKSEVYDAVFDDGIRVSVQIQWGPDWKPLRVTPVSVERKQKVGEAMDYMVENSTYGHDMRLGIATETPIPPQDPAHGMYVEATLRAIDVAYKMTDVDKIHGGAAFRIKESARPKKDFTLTLPFPFERAVAMSLFNADPLLKTILPNGDSESLDMDLVRQLDWVLLQPRTMPLLRQTGGQHGGGHQNHEEVDPELRPGPPPRDFYITNLPGKLTTKDGATHSVSNAEYIAQMSNHDHLEVVPTSRYVGGVQHGALNPKVYRRKKRVSFRMDFNNNRSQLRVDLTTIQQTENIKYVFNNKKRLEVEAEQLLRPGTPAQLLGAVFLAKGFVHDLARYLLGAPKSQHNRPPIADMEPFWEKQRAVDEALPNTPLATLPRVEFPVSDSFGTFSPNMLGSDQQKAGNFYNQLKRDQASRSESLIYHMRCLNNWIKSAALQMFVTQACLSKPQDVTSASRLSGTTGIRILDLACGKGADLRKFISAVKEQGQAFRIEQYVGSDIADLSLEDAVKRASQGKNGQAQLPQFPLRFIAADLGKDPLSAPPKDSKEPLTTAHETKLKQWDSTNQVWEEKPAKDTLSSDETFDLVSMQFAFHYMFQTKQRAETFFKTLSQHMHPGAVFVATTVNPDMMLKKLMQTSSNRIALTDTNGFEICTITFEQSVVDKLLRNADKNQGNDNTESTDESDCYGLRYQFKLADGTDSGANAVDAPEWLIHPNELTRLAKKYNLKPIFKQGFSSFVYDQLDKNPSLNNLIHRMHGINVSGTLSQVEWDVLSLYMVIAFQRIKVEKPSEPNKLSVLTDLTSTVPGFDKMSPAEKNRLLDEEFSKRKRTWEEAIRGETSSSNNSNSNKDTNNISSRSESKLPATSTMPDEGASSPEVDADDMRTASDKPASDDEMRSPPRSRQRLE